MLLGGEVLLGERRIAVQVELGVGEIGLVLRFLRLRLIERGLERPRIDLSEKVAPLDNLAFIEGDLHDLAVDSRPDRDGVVGLDLSEALEHDGKVGALDRGHRNYNRRWAVRLRLLRRRGRGLAGRRPDPVMQLVCERPGRRNPPVRRLGSVDAIGGGRAARQYDNPREPGIAHDWKPFSAPGGRIAGLCLQRALDPGAPARTAPNPQHADASRRRFSRGTLRQYHHFGARGPPSTKFDRRPGDYSDPRPSLICDAGGMKDLMMGAGTKYLAISLSW